MSPEVFIQTMANDLAIKRDRNESLDSWYYRIIYSAAGKTALTCLWNQTGTNETPGISKEALIRHTKRFLSSCITMFPETEAYFYDIDTFANELYDIYLHAGYFYHSKYWIYPPVRIVSEFQKIGCLRGARPFEEFHMSGLGSYLFIDQSQDELMDIMKMFDIPDITLRGKFLNITDDIVWERTDNLCANEYLNTSGKLKDGYWKKIPDKKNQVSLLRHGLKGHYIYQLYKFQNDQFFTASLPSWEVGNSGIKYLSFAAPILREINVLPPIRIQKSEETVRVSANYLFPELQVFFKLFSWHSLPEKDTWHFQRIMSKEIYPIFKSILLKIGYSVEEA